jgi:predicted dehydrogenase
MGFEDSMRLKTLSRRSLLAASPLAVAGYAQAPAAPFHLPRKLRIAMLGFDGHPSIILGELPRLPDVEVVAIYDSNARQLATEARKPLLSKARQYGNYVELLDKERPDIAGICGPTSEHTPAILACTERRIHVACEKPLALSLADLEHIKRAVAASGISLTMFLPMRYEGVFRAMRDIVRRGAIGEAAQIDAQKSYKLGERPEWMRDRSEFGGTIPYIGIHMVDLIRFTSGRELGKSVSMEARVGFPEMRDMENTTGTLFRMDNGGVAVMHLDYLRPDKGQGHGDDRLRIAGTKGVVEYSEHRGLSLVTQSAAERMITDVPATGSLFLDFLDSVYNGKASGLPLQDIYRVNEIVLQAHAASV